MARDPFPRAGLKLGLLVRRIYLLQGGSSAAGGCRLLGKRDAAALVHGRGANVQDFDAPLVEGKYYELRTLVQSLTRPKGPGKSRPHAHYAIDLPGLGIRPMPPRMPTLLDLLHALRGSMEHS